MIVKIVVDNKQVQEVVDEVYRISSSSRFYIIHTVNGDLKVKKENTKLVVECF